ncbi:MAG: alpha/beta hydrolase [Alphaproteobacteria bacterium]|nr:alpha/beta hydrolase [Alphaproteobacteria bacterium]
MDLLVAGLMALSALAWPLAPIARPLCDHLQRAAEASSPPPGRMLTLDDGRRSHVYGRGLEHDGPAVLIVPGAGSCVADQQVVQPLLAKRYRVYAWDRPGIGWSDPHPAGFSQALVAADLRAVLDRLDEPEVILAGHSIGGQTLLRAGAEPPVAGWVLIDPTPWTPESAAAFEDALGPVQAQIPHLERLLDRGFGRVLAPFAAPSSFPPDRRAEADLDVVHAARRVAGAARWRAQMAEVLSLSADCAEVAGWPTPRLPTAVLASWPTRWGPQAERELARLPPASRAIHHADRVARSRWLEGFDAVQWLDCSHFVQADRPEAVVAAVDHVAARLRGEPSDWPTVQERKDQIMGVPLPVNRTMQTGGGPPPAMEITADPAVLAAKARLEADLDELG